MDYLWTPWRYQYLAGEKPRRPGVPAELEAWPGGGDCVFCNLIGAVDWAIGDGMPRDDAERAGLVVARGESVYLCLNRFPYSSGHLMAIPYVHAHSLAALEQRTAFELVTWAQRAERVFDAVYKPDGINLGMNLGEAAGAGVAGHLHLHALPRWTGDANFMTVIGETRILPESLEVTWSRLHEGFRHLSDGARGSSMGEVKDFKQGQADGLNQADRLQRGPEHEEKAASAQAAPTSVEPVTPQDSQAAGATAGTQIDLLKGNVSGSEQQGAAEKAKELEHEAGGGYAGYHSTGSYTGTSGGQK